ncbi:hypothetical protein BH23ACT10_BH23ACT10_23500 [soil metagenome]
MRDDPPADTADGSPATAGLRAGTVDAGQNSATVIDGAARHPASIGKRVGAYIIDYLMVNVVLAIVGVRAGFVPLGAEAMARDQAYVIGAIASLTALVYFVVLEAACGQTLAKWLLGIRVVMVDGTRATVLAALVRRVPFFAGMLVPLVGALFNFAVPLAALITAIQDEPAGRGFHDRWGGTRVVDTAAPTVG